MLERLDAELSETDDTGRPLITGKVAVVAVVGFTIPARGVTYWSGEAMQGVDHLDLEQTPEPVAQATQTLAENAAHLARLLEAGPYS